MKQRIKGFFFPSLTPRFLIRVILVGSLSYLVFGHILTPFFIRGTSMEPTYRDGGFNFCVKIRYLFSEPKRCDVVAIRFAGNQRMLLKRVVALEGEEVEFRKGKLFINGKPFDEPYVQYPCDWNLPPRRVEKGCLYVIGDNRSMPIEEHLFGQTRIERIVGSPLW